MPHRIITPGIAPDRPDGRDDRHRHADMAVEQQWERHHAQPEGQHGKEEAHRIADNDDVVALLSGAAQLAGELGGCGRLVVAEVRLEDRVGDRQPDGKHRQAEAAQVPTIAQIVWRVDDL